MAFTSTEDSRFLPAYTFAEAARYLRMPTGTLRSWVVGRSYHSGGSAKQFQPLIRLEDPSQPYLSFVNLVEAHVLAAIRRGYGLKLSSVRNALDYIADHFHVERPLIEQSFQTDGLDLFVEHYGDLINTSQEGQRAMKEIMGLYLKRIDRDAYGLPIKLYPFTRVSDTDKPPSSDPRVIVMTPTVSYGRPVITGTGIPVAFIYERYQAGDSVADLSQDFGVEIGAIEEAIRCEAA